MLHTAKYLHTKFWLFVAWLIISCAIILSLLRLYLPLLDITPYRQEIERIVQERAGMPLHIGDIRVEIHAAHLALSFSGVSMLDPDTGAVRLQFREAYADIHLLRSLFEGKLVLGRGRVVGGRLNLLRHLDGSITVNGFREGGKGDHSTLRSFLRATELRVQDSVIQWQDQASGQPPLRLSRVNVNLFNNDARHQLAASAFIAESEQQQILLVADLQEGTEDPSALNGHFYVKTEGVELGDRVTPRLSAGVRIEQGLMDLSLWGEVKAGVPSQLTGEIGLLDLRLSSGEVQPLNLDRFATSFNWSRDRSGWKLDLDRLLLQCENQLWPPGRLSMAWQAGESSYGALQLGADYLGLKELTRFAALFDSIGKDLRLAFSGLSPMGHLSRFRLALNQAEAQPTRWQVSGSITQYRNRPWKSIPGLSGLGLKFEGDQDGGTMLVGSKGFMADMPRLFRDKLKANQLDGSFKWQLSQQEGVRLLTRNLSMSTDDLQTLSRLDLRVPFSGEAPVVDMQTDFWNGDGSQKGRYLPVGIMAAPLVAWLDRAVVSGHINAGTMLLYGPLSAFPFLNHEGRFEVLFGIEELVLDYMPGWPRLEEGVAEAHFLNNSLKIDLFEGKMLATDLQRATAHIRKLKGGSPVEIEGRLSGPVSDLLRILGETPLKRHFGAFTDAVAGSGQSQTGFKLGIPLKKSDTLKLNGSIDFKNGSLNLKGQDLHLAALRGQLRFNSKEVWSHDLHGRLLNQLVELTVSPRIQGEERFTRVSTSLNVGSDWLRQRFPGRLEPLQGTAMADLDLDIAHTKNDTPVSLSIGSTLDGMAINLPSPLGKSMDETRKIRLGVGFRGQGVTDLRVNYAGFTQALLRDEGEGFLKGEVRFGQGVPKLPGSSVIRLAGKLESLDVSPWVGWVTGREPDKQARQVKVKLDLLVGELELAGIACPDARLLLKPLAGGWRVSLDSAEVSGVLELPRDLRRKPLVARLQRLKLKSADLRPAETGSVASGMGELDPSDLPALDLLVDALVLDEKNLGKALLQWVKVPFGIRISNLALVGEGLDLSGDGYWSLMGKQHTTKLKLQGHVDDLGQLQEDLGMQLGIDEAPLDFSAELSWPQSPHELKLETLSGEIKVKMGAGEVTEVDPGVGRLVGLFSLHALGKRLLLDFSDLSAKGLKFDRIEGNFDISDGSAYTTGMKMSGPSVKVDMSGRTGLSEKDYDQLITVTPRVSSTFPIVGALALNPTVGVVLVVAQQLFGKQMDRITQTEYQLTGSWDAPVITKLSGKDEEDLMPDPAYDILTDP